MTHLLKTVLVIILLTFSMFEMKSQQSSSQGVPIALRQVPKGNSSGRKRMPSKDIVYCWYNSGSIYFDLSESFGVCDVEIVNLYTNMAIATTIAAGNPVGVSVGNAMNLLISVIIEDGIIYYGEM